MWPFNRFRQRRYERRYKAAMVVLLGTYMMERLSPEQQARVESEVDANLNRSDTPARAWRRWAGRSDFMGACRAVGMQKAGIAPPVATLSWRALFEPWASSRKMSMWPILPGFDVLPLRLVLDFRPMNQATVDARAYLREHGFNLADFDPWVSASQSIWFMR